MGRRIGIGFRGLRHLRPKYCYVDIISHVLAGEDATMKPHRQTRCGKGNPARGNGGPRNVASSIRSWRDDEV